MRNLLVVALLSLVVAGCNSENSPTAPLPPAQQTYNARITMGIATTSSHTLRTVAMTYDGREVARTTISGGGTQATLEATVQTTRGRHVIGMVIIDQASSPNQYFATGSIIGAGRVIDLIDVKGVLATGETLELKVDL